MGADHANIKTAAAKEGAVTDRLISQAADDFLRFRTGKVKSRHLFTQIADSDTIIKVVIEPAHMPFTQVIRPHDPPFTVTPVEDGQITLQPAFRAEHRGEARHVPGLGRQEAIIRSSHASALGPLTSNLEKPEISRRPTPFRTPWHSFATISKAFDRFSDGVSSNPFSAK